MTTSSSLPPTFQAHHLIYQAAHTLLSRPLLGIARATFWGQNSRRAHDLLHNGCHQKVREDLLAQRATGKLICPVSLFRVTIRKAIHFRVVKLRIQTLHRLRDHSSWDRSGHSSVRFSANLRPTDQYFHGVVKYVL